MPVVTQKTVNDYWVEQQQTGTFAGIGRAYTLTQQHGEIFHTFEMVIDATGRPTKYRLISIKPELAKADVELWRVILMMKRYAPSATNTEKNPVLFRDTVKSWIPKGDLGELPNRP